MKNIRKEMPLPSVDNRVFICGKTGSGKTTLAKFLISRYRNAIVLDVTGTINIKGFTIKNSFDSLSKVLDGRFIYRPTIEEMETDYDFLFEWIYHRENTALLIDELYAVSKNALDIPTHLRAILTRGRARKITCIVNSQTPHFVPHFVISQAEYFYIFQLHMPQDKRKISSITGLSEQDIDRLGQYEFWALTIGKNYGMFKLKIK